MSRLRSFFFFSSRRRHTRCLSDWSSDVCSSDLGGDPKYSAGDITDRPAPTVTVGSESRAGGGASNHFHVVDATERRKFTIAELRRICAFPDDFILTGTYAQQWERLGNSVPPLMMKAIAETIRDKVLAR